MDAIITKKCTKCGESKPLSEYYGDSRKKDRKQVSCKSCHNKVVLDWALRNKDKLYVANKKYRDSHKEKMRNRWKDWYRTNSKEVINRQKEYYKAHSDKKEDRLKYNINYRKKHLQERREQLRKFFCDNPEKVFEYHNNRRARRLNNGGTITAEEWNDVLNKYGNKCICCGREDVRLTLDHVVPLFSGGRNSVDNVQPLCRSCNSKKGIRTIDYRNLEEANEI